MRHGDKIKNLGRTAAHRAALLSNLCCQLIEHKRLFTTLAKAKSLRIYAEPLITRSKADNMNNRRVVFSYLQDKEAIKELFGVIGDKVANRPGGYTRIIKLPHRMGDAADMAMIELVDFNESYNKELETAAVKKTRRSRRSGKKEGTQQTSGNVETAVAEQTHHEHETVAHIETAEEVVNNTTIEASTENAENHETENKDNENNEQVSL